MEPGDQVGRPLPTHPRFSDRVEKHPPTPSRAAILSHLPDRLADLLRILPIWRGHTRQNASPGLFVRHPPDVEGQLGQQREREVDTDNG
jgi:hypothetical protein